MNEKHGRNIHWSFWIIGIAALVWNVMGAINFIVQMNPDAHAAYPPAARAIIEGRPAWATAGFAVAVFVGSLGSLLLLLRKPAAFYLFSVSLLGALVTMIHTIGVAGAEADFSTSDAVMMIVMPVVVAAILVWYSRHVKTRGWMRPGVS